METDLKKLIMSKEINEGTFGRFLRARRENMGISVRSFAKELECSAAYLSDIEKGNRYAPKKYKRKIFELLELPEEDWGDFDDLAAATRGFFYEDINPYLGQEHMARVALRTAMEKNVSSEYWEMIIKNLEDQ